MSVWQTISAYMPLIYVSEFSELLANRFRIDLPTRRFEFRLMYDNMTAICVNSSNQGYL